MLDRLVVFSEEANEVKQHHLAVCRSGERLVVAFTSGVLIFELDGTYVRKGGHLEGGRRVATSGDGVVGGWRPPSPF